MTGTHVFLTDEETQLTITHDSGPVSVGVPGVVAGRKALIAELGDLPDGNGAERRIERKAYTLIEHGVLWMSRLNPETGSVGFDADTIEVIINRPFVDSQLPQIVRRGAFFALETGEYFTAIQASLFNGLPRYLREGEAGLGPVLQQLQDLGFNMVRAWTLFDIPGIGRCTLEEFPDLYERIPEFVGLCASHGLYVEFTAYTGINDPDHWDRLIAASLACATRPLLELVNELDQNLNEQDHLRRSMGPDTSLFGGEFGSRIHGPFEHAPAPLLSAHGSNGSQARPVRPPWSYETFHYNDAPEWPRKVGHNSMEDGADATGKPAHAGENTRPDHDPNPNHHEDAAAGAALLAAGCCFHSQSGKQAILLTGNDYVCAEASARGARSVPLWAQDGRYHRVDDPDYSRTYQRILTDRRHTVQIRH
jgi:hypothetical protein